MPTGFRSNLAEQNYSTAVYLADEIFDASVSQLNINLNSAYQAWQNNPEDQGLYGNTKSLRTLLDPEGITQKGRKWSAWKG